VCKTNLRPQAAKKPPAAASTSPARPTTTTAAAAAAETSPSLSSGLLAARPRQARVPDRRLTKKSAPWELGVQAGCGPHQSSKSAAYTDPRTRELYSSLGRATAAHQPSPNQSLKIHRGVA
jgi:hypothetical protein